MNMLDIEPLLVPTADTAPCGPSLEYDPAYLQLEKAASRVAAQDFGKQGTQAQEPKWPEVLELSRNLLSRSKDLRVAVQMLRALMHTHGIAALPAGMRLLHQLLERYWDQLHPELESDGDATMRVNALAALASVEAFVCDLRDAALVSSREHGRLTVREVEVALGRLLPAPGSKQPALDQIRAQLAAANAAGHPVQQAVTEAISTLNAIRTLLNERVAGTPVPDFKPLTDVLNPIRNVCDDACGTPLADTQAHEAEGAPRAAAQPASGGEVRSRDDALRLLERVCGYLERSEPANPAPLLIRRAQRLMTKSFMEIVQDLMPDSLSTVERLAGKTETK
jgi:type VI secretion system protein ImpA